MCHHSCLRKEGRSDWEAATAVFADGEEWDIPTLFIIDYMHKSTGKAVVEASSQGTSAKRKNLNIYGHIHVYNNMSDIPAERKAKVRATLQAF